MKKYHLEKKKKNHEKLFNKIKYEHQNKKWNPNDTRTGKQFPPNGTYEVIMGDFLIKPEDEKDSTLQKQKSFRVDFFRNESYKKKNIIFSS